MPSRLFPLLLALVLSACEGAAPPEIAPQPGANPPPKDAASATEVLFGERAAEIGLDFVHFNGRTGEHDLAEITCGGGGFLDVDNDGDLDVYLAQGQILGTGKTLDDALDTPHHAPPWTDRLYRNELIESGVLRFTDITTEAGLETTAGYGCGVAAGDVDNDGWTDLVVLNLGPNQLLRNLGGTFEDVTPPVLAQVADPSAAGLLADFDRDGFLDLFVGNYVAFDHEQPPRCFDQTGAPDYCGPGAYSSAPDRLLHNLGATPDIVGGRPDFADATTVAGLARGGAPTLGAVAGDFDGDGWLDLYVANDGRPNHLWMHRGADAPRRLGFEDRALLAGAGVNADGAAEASMGVDAADVDNDGDLDIFLTHLKRETNTLYLNDGAGFFEDRTLAAGLSAASLPFTSFGTAFVDVDNDGWLDLFVASGAVTHEPELVRRGDPFPLHQANQLFRNLGALADTTARGVRFADVTSDAGEAFALSEVSRGAAFGDVDNDGDLDVLVINNGGPVRLLENQVGSRGTWLGLRLVGRPGLLRDAPGTRIEILRRGAPTLTRWVRLAGSYGAAHDPRMLAGLGAAREVEAVVVTWPDGARERFVEVEVGRYTTLTRGTGQPELEPS